MVIRWLGVGLVVIGAGVVASGAGVSGAGVSGAGEVVTGLGSGAGTTHPAAQIA